MDLHPGTTKDRFLQDKWDVFLPTRQAFHQNEEWYQDLVEHSQDLLCVHDLEGRILSVDPTPARLLGYTVEEMLRTPMRDLVPPEFRGGFDAYLKQIQCEGEARGLLFVLTKSGERRIWEYSNTLRREGAAAPVVSGIARDVTEQKQAEHRLRETNEKLLHKIEEGERTIAELQLFRTLVDQSNDAIQVVDPETLRFLDANEKACSSLGYSRQELLSLGVFDIDAAIAKDSTAKIREELKRSGFFTFESVHRRKDGTTFPVELRIAQVRLDKNYAVAVARDLTDSKQAADLLRASEERLRLFVAGMKDHAIFMLDGEGYVINWNAGAESIQGYSAADIVGRNFSIFHSAEDQAKDKPAQELVTAASQGRFVDEGWRIRKDGSKFWAHVVTTALRDVNGELRGFGKVVRDVTERREAQEKLREYEKVVEGLEEIIVVVDRDYRYVIANRALLRYRGVTKEQLIGRRMEEVLGREIFETTVRPKMAECFRGKAVQFEKKYTYPRVGERDFLVSYLPIEGPTGVDRIACVMQDISERKKAESRLQEYERVVEGLEEMIVVMDRDYRYVIANRAYLNYRSMEKDQIVGHTASEIIGENAFETTVKPKLDECFQGRVVTYEMKHTYAGMGERDLFLSYFPIEGPSGIDRIACILKDVTERRLVEQVLQASECQQRKIATQLETERARLVEAQAVAKVGSWEAELPSLNVTWSEQTHRIFETDPAHFHPTRPNFVNFIHPEDRAKVDAAFEASLEKRAPCSVEYRILMPDSRVKVLEERWKIFYDEQGRPVRLMGTCQDITERKRSDQDLQDAKEFSENLIQTANVMILSLDLAGNVVLMNGAAEEITGYTFQELRGENWSALVPRDRFPLVWEEFDRLIAGTADKTFENPILTKSGKERYIAWRSNQLKLNGDVVATISFGIDITEQRRADDALRRSEENYRNFVSQSSEGIFREEMDAPVPVDLPEDQLVHHILYDSSMAECNDALAKMYGLESGKDLVGKRLSEMLITDDPHNIQLTREYIRSGFRVLERESHEVDMLGNPKIFLNSMIGAVENGTLVRTWGIQRDITEKVKLEDARGKAEDNLRQTVDQLQQVTEELRLAKEKLSEEKLYLEDAINTELGFGEIIGRSPALKVVLEKVAKVAPSDATVLLLGETGTGKELVARALHRLSHRQGSSFIKMNCAAIPSGLLESELFGHERGAFTGAVARKLGRLELADKGTLFLDEIGEIPVALQPKLLRVLQDQEFERLGGTQTLKVNFRLLAATNRDLLQSVKLREFRSDLYYRLNVFPIVIPPLRERREDIRPLAEHFVTKFANHMKKSITSVPSKTMELLVRWDWPGNIRELENFIERSVILTPGSVLQAPLAELQPDSEKANGFNKDSLRGKERDRILNVLQECHGKLGGADGAAARLGLKRTTLQSKLDHLGIKPASFRS